MPFNSARMNRCKQQVVTSKSTRQKNSDHLADNGDLSTTTQVLHSPPPSVRPLATTTTLSFDHVRSGITQHNRRTGPRNSKNNVSSLTRCTRFPVVSSSTRSITPSVSFDKYSTATFASKKRNAGAVVPRRANTTVARKVNNVDKKLLPSDAIVTKNYTIRPVVPAAKKELIAVAKAMHRESFAPRVKTLFQSETEAAMEAINSGIYVGFRCPEFTWDCIRLGTNSKCFCDHALSDHEPYNGKKVHVKCRVPGCMCRAYRFIPQRPEDIGEWWHQRRPGFDVSTWRAKCRCKHTHVEHNPVSRKCTNRGCGCFIFTSNFLCAACDRHWEEHETCFDNVTSRKQQGLPYGEEYIPFHELSDLKHMCLTGSEVSSPFSLVPKR